MKKITVITVCLNAANELEKTIISILEQKQCTIQYIIKDGFSTDNTVDIIEMYREQLIQRGHVFEYVQKEDEGIYDAMNQALEYCNDSDYTIFINAGDTLYDKYVLKQLSQVDSNSVILLGLTYLNYSHGRKLILEPVFKNNTIDFCHQSVLVDTKVLKSYKFDVSYKIAADRDLVLKLMKHGCSVEYLNMIISRYSCNGVSSRSFDGLYEEIDRMNTIYGISQKKHNKGINKVKTLCARINPTLADISAIYKKSKRSR